MPYRNPAKPTTSHPRPTSAWEFVDARWWTEYHESTRVFPMPAPLEHRAESFTDRPVWRSQFSRPRRLVLRTLGLVCRAFMREVGYSWIALLVSMLIGTSAVWLLVVVGMPGAAVLWMPISGAALLSLSVVLDLFEKDRRRAKRTRKRSARRG